MEANLKMVAFHITPVCENKCEYCYVGNLERNTHPPYERIEKILNELSTQDIENILLVGGDPCKYPHLLKVSKLAKTLGLHVGILSNTLSFKKYEFSEIIENVDSFDATILGLSDIEHDLNAKKKGAYEELMGNIKALNKHGIQVGIVFNATPDTYDKFFGMIKNLIENEKISINQLMIQRIIPHGRATNTLKHCLNISQVNILFQELEKIEDVYKLKIVFEDPFPLCIVDPKYHKFITPCSWGFTKGSISSQGDLSRCGADVRYRLGNIFERKLKVIWNTSPVLISFRERKWLPKKCLDCNLLERCGGGCSLSRISEKDHDSDILMVT